MNRFTVHIYRDGILVASIAREHSKELPKEIQEILL